MAGAARPEVEVWNVESLRIHFHTVLDERDGRYECRFSALGKEQTMAREGVGSALVAAREAIGIALVAQEREVAKVDAINERRFEAMTATNERRFEALMTQRRTSDDQTRLMMPRTEAEQRFASLDEKAQERHKALDDKLASLVARIDGNEGRSRGLSAGWTYLIGAIGGAAGVIGIVLAVMR